MSIDRPSLLVSRRRFSSIARQYSKELVSFTLEMISEDGKSVPAHQREWRIGASFSWHYVKTVEYRLSNLITALEQVAMARTGKKSKGNYDASAYVFVKAELRTEDKKAAKIWIDENTAELGSLLHDAIASDYKFTCSFSSDFDTFTACLVGKEDNAINGKKTLTARHKDWMVAAMTVLYKHLVMFKGGVWTSAIDDDEDGWA